MAKEAGDDDFGDMGCVGTAVAHTHHSEEIKFSSALAEEGEGKQARKRKEEENGKVRKNGKILSLEELSFTGVILSPAYGVSLGMVCSYLL